MFSWTYYWPRSIFD